MAASGVANCARATPGTPRQTPPAMDANRTNCGKATMESPSRLVHPVGNASMVLYHVPMTRTHRPELAQRGRMAHRFCSMGLGIIRIPGDGLGLGIPGLLGSG